MCVCVCACVSLVLSDRGGRIASTCVGSLAQGHRFSCSDSGVGATCEELVALSLLSGIPFKAHPAILFCSHSCCPLGCRPPHLNCMPLFLVQEIVSLAASFLLV